MSYQPRHWVVRKSGADSERGAQGTVQCVVIAETMEDALEQGASFLRCRPTEVTATRITSGHPVGG